VQLGGPYQHEIKEADVNFDNLRLGTNSPLIDKVLRFSLITANIFEIKRQKRKLLTSQNLAIFFNKTSGINLLAGSYIQANTCWGKYYSQTITEQDLDVSKFTLQNHSPLEQTAKNILDDCRNI
jgi:hypothetical protein